VRSRYGLIDADVGEGLERGETDGTEEEKGAVSVVPVDLDRSFTVDGYRLVYDVYGVSTAPLVVYLSGLLLDAELNRGIAQALADQGYRVALLDLLGHGRSDKPTHAAMYRIDSYANQVTALMDHLGVDKTVLGGISLGANVSLFVAARYPERVQALVLEMPVLERAVPAAAMVFVPLLVAAHYGRPVLDVVSGLISRVHRTRFGPLNSVLNAFSAPADATAAVLHGILVGPVAPTQEERRAIAVPTLVLAHRNDLIHPFDDAVNLVARLPHASLVRARSPLELRLRPGRLTKEIVAFLSRVEPPSTRRPSDRSA
jgi:pimeloyl-ACP methyl ester carboxylesterase